MGGAFRAGGVWARPYRARYHSPTPPVTRHARHARRFLWTPPRPTGDQSGPTPINRWHGVTWVLTPQLSGANPQQWGTLAGRVRPLGGSIGPGVREGTARMENALAELVTAHCERTGDTLSAI